MLGASRSVGPEVGVGQGDAAWDPTGGRGRSGHGRPPFGDTVITAWHLERPAITELLDDVEWDVLRARRSGALVVPRGCGRSHLLRIITERANPVQWESLYLPNPNLDLAGFARLVLGLLGTPHAKDEPLGGLERYLDDLWAEGRSLLVSADDAETMPATTLRQLLDLASRRAPTLVLLFGLPDDAIEGTPFGDLEEAWPVARLSSAMSLGETAGYLHHRLARAGAGREVADRFTSEVVEHLHAMSSGEPAWLHTLAQVLAETLADAADRAWSRFLRDERGILELASEAARLAEDVEQAARSDGSERPRPPDGDEPAPSSPGSSRAADARSIDDAELLTGTS